MKFFVTVSILACFLTQAQAAESLTVKTTGYLMLHAGTKEKALFNPESSCSLSYESVGYRRKIDLGYELIINSAPSYVKVSDAKFKSMIGQEVAMLGGVVSFGSSIEQLKDEIKQLGGKLRTGQITSSVCNLNS